MGREDEGIGNGDVERKKRKKEVRLTEERKTYADEGIIVAST